MSQLDRHVAGVQNRLALAIFFRALAQTCLMLAAAILAMVAVQKLLAWSPPRPWLWIGIGVAVATIAALIGAIRRRPSKFQAAAAIDQKLSLHEKISTALYVRPSSDPFAIAAVKDAEATARDVVLNYAAHFPFQFPRLAPLAILVALAAFLLATYITPLDLLGHQEAIKKQVAQQQKIEFSKKQLQDALAVVNSVPQSIANDETVRMARQDLAAQLSKGVDDPAKASRTALKALQDVDAAVKQQIKTNTDYAQAKADEKMWRQIGEQPITDPGPVNDVRKELAQGDLSHAMDDLSKVVNNFDKMDKSEQQKAAEQMKQMAQQLQQQANATPQQQQQMQHQLQQMGLSQQQAQQLMQQAASGDKQSQQQLQQMAQQAMKQMNNGQGPTPQQQQQAQQMMQQMQAAANNQAQAQQLSQAAQQMAQAMNQQAQQSQQQQQAGQQQAQQRGQQQGQQQGAQQQAQQQASQKGQGQPSGQQGMSQGMQQMQAQLQQMQAVASDAQQIAAAQQNAQQGAQQAMNNANGNSANGQPAQGALDGGQGQWGAPEANQPPQKPGNPGQGPPGGGGGQGAGSPGAKAQAPYTLKQEVDTSDRIDSGKLLATTFVKASALKGENKLELKQIAASAEKDETDEIDQDRISRQAQGVVRDYFKTMETDAAQPTSQP